MCECVCLYMCIYVCVSVSVCMCLGVKEMYFVPELSLTLPHSFQHDHNVHHFNQLCVHDTQQPARMVQTSRVSNSTLFYCCFILMCVFYFKIEHNRIVRFSIQFCSILIVLFCCIFVIYSTVL